MDHLPSNYSPFRQQLEGSWFRSHLNSSAWHTSFQYAVVCVDAHRSVCSLWVKTAQNCTSTLTVNTHRSVCPLWVKTAQNCTSTLTVNTHRSVCPLWVKRAQNCTSTLTVNTHRSVCPLWVKTACIWLVPHTRHMGSKPDSVRSDSNRADHIKVVHNMSDVHGFRKHIAVCFHTGRTVLVPCTELGNVGVHSSV